MVKLDLLMNEPSSLALFSDRTVDYANYRPDYPAEALDAILAGLGEANKLIIADIGAGTGIAARQLAARGATVIAIEPNQQMRNAATPHPRVEFSNGTAENTGLADNSVDLVTCFMSFHWFSSIATLSEFDRILKPSGRLAVVWILRSMEDDFSKNYNQIIENASKYCLQIGTREQVRSIAASSLFTEVKQREFPHYQRLDRAGLIGLARSQGYLY
ncbi:MAG: class I SAM-dependent methyltransferase, partial [Prochloraceae cyanobacterium]|nr:class I SAM-dependent methyltransferase [Prochloraceae cyanobacterium]